MSGVMHAACSHTRHLDIKNLKHTHILMMSNRMKQTSTKARVMQLVMVYHMVARPNDVQYAVFVLLCGHDGQLTLGFFAGGAASAAWA